jgi:hypothetical protein
MSSSEHSASPAVGVESDANRDLKQLYERVQATLSATTDPTGFADRELQDLLALACKLYATRRQEGVSLDAFGPLQSDAGLTATDGALTASALLDAVSVEVFELGMWRTWGTAG